MKRAVPEPASDLAEKLADYRCRFPAEKRVVDRFLVLLQDHPECFERNHFTPGHVTGSAWLVDPAGGDVLLTHHRKLDAWLQLGGHSDGDRDTAAVAIREAEEESGLSVALLRPEIFDLDVHEIPARKDDPAHYHFDVRYALASTSGRDYRISEESHDLAWVPIDGLHRFTDETSMLRMARKWAAIRELDGALGGQRQ